jgi:hypothetical protein
MEDTTMAIESPKYEVEKEEGSFEIRTYASYIVAQVDVESDFDGALRNGFEILAHYIFGGNKKKESIPMTAPVSEEIPRDGSGDSRKDIDDCSGDSREDIDDCARNRRTGGRTLVPSILRYAIEVHARNAP